METELNSPAGLEIRSIAESLHAILPELVLTVGFLVLILLEIMVGKKVRWAVPVTALATVCASTTFVIAGWPEHPVSHFSGMIITDGFSSIFQLIFLLATGITILGSVTHTSLKADSNGMGEYYLLLLPMTLGMAFMSMGVNLLFIYLAIELVSLPSYILTAYTRLSRKSAEASLKYVIYGAFSSGVMLYGISWIYGMTGTLDLVGVEAGLAGVPPTTSALAVGLVICGIAFKITALPFHFWAPDIYAAVPYPVAAFFATAPKAAGFAILIRLAAMMPDGSLQETYFFYLMSILSLAGMTWGNLAALRQENFKRMLAYSGIAHSGYMLAGVACISETGNDATVFYLVVYLFMNMGAFYALGWLAAQAGTEHIHDLRGLGPLLPWLTISITILMIGLTGLPGTAGFIAKLQVLVANATHFSNPIHLTLMAGIVINTVISLFFYMRIPAIMVFQNPALKITPRLHAIPLILILILTIPVLLLGLVGFDTLANFIHSEIAASGGLIP